MKSALVLSVGLLLGGNGGKMAVDRRRMQGDTASYPDTNTYGGGYGGGYGDTNYNPYTAPTQPPAPVGCWAGSVNMFWGSRFDVPPGYQVCDGSNGTPDLQGKFPVGAGKDFPYYTTGGSTKVKLTIDNLPYHRHNIDANDMYMSAAGDHCHVATGKIKESGGHTHDQGTLDTSVCGNHNHPFGGESDEGGHTHCHSLETDKGGIHNHPIDICTGDGGNHNHDNDFNVEVEGSAHSHDIAVVIEAAVDHAHKVNIDDFEIKVDDHNHGVGDIKPADHYYKHNHYIVGGVTDSNGAHQHHVDTDTMNAGDHGHDWDFDTDEQGGHCHDKGTLTTLDSGNHKHEIKEYQTDIDGDHDHTFNAYLELTYNTPDESAGFEVALDRVDTTKGYVQSVSKDDGHSHHIPETATCSAGDHWHDITGKTGNNGKHWHDVTGTLDNCGDHTHQVSCETSTDDDHDHTVNGQTTEEEVTLCHEMSGYTAPDGGFTYPVENVCGKTSDDGAHCHTATAQTTSDGEHTHKLEGCVKNNGIHTHKLNGNTKDAGDHGHKIIGTIGGYADGEHDHDISGETVENGKHNHVVKGNTGNSGEHCHEITILNAWGGQHSHQIYGKTQKTGNGYAIDVTPPYIALYFICCTGNYDTDTYQVPPDTDTYAQPAYP